MNVANDVDSLTVLYYRFALRSWAHVPIAAAAGLVIGAGFHASVGSISGVEPGWAPFLFGALAGFLVFIGLMQIGITLRELTKKLRQLEKATDDARKFSTSVMDSSEKNYRALELAIVSSEAFHELHGGKRDF